MSKLIDTYRSLVYASDLKRVNDDYIDLVAYFSASALFSFFRPKVSVPSDGSTPSVNFYGLAFSGSGTGKDRMIRIFRTATEEAEQKLYGLYDYAYDEAYGNQERGLVTGGKHLLDGSPVGPMIFYSNGTPEGIEKLRSEASAVGFGATSNIISELALEISHLSYLNGILEMYDFGKSPQKLVQHERRVHATDVPMNVMWYSAPENIFNDKKVYDVFKKTLSQGLARRSFCVFLDKEDFSQNVDYDRQKYDELSSELSTLIIDSLHLLYNNNTLVLSKEAEIEYDRYHEECTERSFALNRAGSYATELQNRYWKVLKLAGVIAISECSSVIEKEHFIEAKEFAERLDAYQKRTHTVVTEPERIMDYLKEVRKPTTIAELQKNGFNIDNRNKYEIVNRIEEMIASSGDYLLDFTEKTPVKLEVRELELTKLDNIVFSWSDNPSQADNIMYPSSAPYDNLIPALQSDSVAKIGMFLYRGNRRSKDTVIGGGNLLIFDVDELTPISYVLDVLSDYKGFIYTSRSHQKPKLREDGTVKSHAQDRFRIILVSKFAVPTDADEVADILSNFGIITGVNIDTNTLDTARFFFVPNDADFVEFEGENLIDYRFFRSGTQSNRQLESSVNKYKKSDDWAYGDLVSIKESAIKFAVMGSRNVELFKAAMKLKDTEFNGQYFNEDQIMKHVYDINSCLPDPLSTKELDLTIRSTLKKKIKERGKSGQ